MVRRKYRRLFIFLLVIVVLNFFKMIFITDNIIYIINISYNPKTEFITGHQYFNGFFMYKKFNLEKNALLKFNSIGIPYFINLSNNILIKKAENNIFIFHEKNIHNFKVENLTFKSQIPLNIIQLTNIIKFLKNIDINIPKNLFILETQYKQSFFVPKNYIFIRPKDIKNGIFVHELSHYTFGYKIQRKNKNDIWPEIICEAIRLKYLSLYDYNLYNEILNKKTDTPDQTYSQILKYPLILKKLNTFIFEMKNKYNNTSLSDQDFFKFYYYFERRENN
ncbi:hypothetical protein [Marinitoga aeolica]|uniref:Peptidase MA-like domain-containing protein n=1 Tax=Marinitoga aeolica TaxID=2809031 RepID=A0ABY8PR53_9BACT|nr:hypothetical protein [Marinitoga aeolica]WGS65137.1 hypothetical protein JRV97_00860 [Marinitoga aeolica]